MKFRSLGLLLLISAILLVLIGLNLWDLYDVLNGKGDYPFGSEFFSQYSIYRSKTTYILYNVLSTVLLIITIILAFKRKWNVFLIILLIDIFLFCYPLFTKE